MPSARDIVSKYFTVSRGELSIAGLRIGTVAARFGTPLFVYDRSVLERKWETLRSTLPAKFEISYSVKANPNQAIIHHFVSKGAGLEIASAGEFHQALTAGCEPARILFAGPGKTEAELEFVIERGIGEIHVESITEIERIAAVCSRLGIKAGVALRVNPAADARGGAMRMGGKPAPFGVDEEQLDGVLDRILDVPQFDFRGIHLFTATQVLDHRVLADQYRKGLDIATRVVRRIGRPLATVDFGGGLGIPYFANEQELDMTELGLAVDALMAGIHDDRRFAGTRFVIEPGRYLVGESGVYLTRVNDIKTSRGKKYLVVDGGMNHHLAASGNLGQVIKRNFPVAIVNRMHEDSTEEVDVVGPLCTPLDVIARDVILPRAELGDLVAVFQSGAYARTASPLGFLSHPTPAEVWVQDGEASIIRRRGTIDDLMGDMVPAPTADGGHPSKMSPAKGRE